MKLTKKTTKKTKKRKLRPNHNRTPKSAAQKNMTLAFRQFPTELVWKMRVRSGQLQMTMKEFVIQEMTKATAKSLEKIEAEATDQRLMQAAQDLDAKIAAKNSAKRKIAKVK